MEKVLQIGKKDGVELYKVSMSGWPFDLWEPLDQIENEIDQEIQSQLNNESINENEDENEDEYSPNKSEVKSARAVNIFNKESRHVDSCL